MSKDALIRALSPTSSPEKEDADAPGRSGVKRPPRAKREPERSGRRSGP
jgi:hypothetical protein